MATRAFTRNAPYIKQQFYALLGNTSPTVKFICIVTICGYIISYSDLAITVLSVTPGYLLPPAFWIWTAFTFCFLEIHFWEVLMDIVTVGLCGKLIEPLWGQMQMLTFFAIVNIGVAVLSSLYYLFLYVCTKNTEILFDVHIHGLAGYVAAVSVAVRQIMPDLLIAKTPIGKLTNRNIPLTVLFLSIILWICGLLDGTFPVMFTSGLIVSWIYLRFYQRHTNSNRGDASENFTFSSFFPNVMQPMVSILVNPIYVCCVRVGVIKSLVARSVSNASLTSVGSSNSSMTMASVDFHDMERRRQIALKALSERLSKTTDLNRQNNTSKSFPQAGKQQQHHHHHHHHHNQHNLHHQQHPMLNSFTIPAIPLPPPPSTTTTTTTTQSSSNASHMVPTNANATTSTTTTSTTTCDNTSSNTLIDIEQNPPIS